MATAAPSRRHASHFPSGGRVDDRGEGVGELDGGGADAARASVDEHALPGTKRPTLKEIGPDSEERFRDGRCSDHVQAIWNRQALSSRDGAVLGVAAARDQRTHTISSPPSSVGGSRDDRSGDFEARDVGRSRGRRILAEPLHHVGAVDPRGRDVHEHVTGSWQRHRPRYRLEDIRSASAGNLDDRHQHGNWHHRRSLRLAGASPSAQPAQISQTRCRSAY